MDRLISEKALLDKIDEWKGFDTVTIRLSTLRNIIKAIPSAYKGMTNGEVIKAVFPHEDVYKGELGYDVGGCTIDFDWWNSPYEPQERSE